MKVCCTDEIYFDSHTILSDGGVERLGKGETLTCAFCREGKDGFRYERFVRSKRHVESHIRSDLK